MAGEIILWLGIVCLSGCAGPRSACRQRCDARVSICSLRMLLFMHELHPGALCLAAAVSAQAASCAWLLVSHVTQASRVMTDPSPQHGKGSGPQGLLSAPLRPDEVWSPTAQHFKLPGLRGASSVHFWLSSARHISHRQWLHGNKHCAAQAARRQQRACQRTCFRACRYLPFAQPTQDACTPQAPPTLEIPTLQSP